MSTDQQSRFDPRPVTLQGRRVRLEPLAIEHADGLFEAAQDDAFWQYMSVPRPITVADVRVWMDEALAKAACGEQVPFTIFCRNAQRIVGSTRYMDIQRPYRGLEIGWTWLTPTAQRTAINTECKLLLLGHAFEQLGAERVCLKTDSRNLRSQEAIVRIGAQREGVLRRHILRWDGVWRDTVYYSVIRDEWPRVRSQLTTLLERS